jgi:Arc/MetJ-type ribon-helix-helix transcriptional regulator
MNSEAFPMIVDIPTDLTDFVQQELSSGRNPSEQELVLAGLRILKQERTEAIESIKRGWESAQRGEGIPLDEADRQLRGQFGLPRRFDTCPLQPHN